ncbi:hypothetical protein ABOM_008733 [Aspergillus bombycis]|uniref:Zn(2)-C6 fungal-type domain-containing protein n=1 Tax=Aspergillus bombycis TaxID=109264 RepID=A0A1F7ZV99_9EURO|nr:hypothetical protein ABOM_008733 [Aspergillus bombycis]OGM43337.1 hypothetical protein ABOM_008733 [Aspergillus bombycis]
MSTDSYSPPDLQVPLPSTLTGRKRPKLRSSCDACGGAKVRCDKVQPHCGRCAAMGLTCVYGLSRKIGKPPRGKPAISERIAREKGSSTPHCTPRMVSEYSMHPSPQHALPPIDVPSGILCDLPSSASHPVAPMVDINDVTDFEVDSGLGTSIDFDMFAGWGFPDHTDAFMGMGDAESFAKPTSLSPASDDNIHRNGANCHRTAYGMLESLCFRSTPEENPSVQTLDQILHRNEEVITKLRQLLKCICSRSPHLTMLYASILSKVLIWYQQAAGCKHSSSWRSSSSTYAGSGSCTSSSGQQSTTPSLAQSTGSLIVSKPIMIGTFAVKEESTQEILKKQLILCELKKLSALNEIFSSQGSAGNHHSGGGVDDLDFVYMYLI